MEFEIQLRSVQDVLRFVAMATKQGFPVLVGSRNHQVNGKSFMEMFSLDLKRPVTVRTECTEEEFQRFRQEAECFPVR